MSTQQEAYEIKFHIYDGNELELEQYTTQYDQLKDEYRDKGTVMSKVISYFFEGLTELVKGDQMYWDENYTEALEFYQNAKRMYSRFNNSRNVQNRLDDLADRLLARSMGHINMTEGLMKENQREEKYKEALKHYNKEVSIANEMEETMSSYAAFARASYAESLLLLHQANNAKDKTSGETKKKLMNARGSIRQAAFIDPRYQDDYFRIEDRLDDLTKERIIVKAENYADEATMLSENGDYEEAENMFKKASLFYERASTLSSDTSSRRFLLSSGTVYQASEIEAKANRLFRRDDETSEAANKFQEAAKLVDKALALMGRFGSDNLENTFASQRDYYKAMSLQATAINLFDNDQYEEAKSIFNESIGLFQETIELAKKCENDVIVSLSEEAIADIKGYLSMCDMML